MDLVLFFIKTCLASFWCIQGEKRSKREIEREGGKDLTVRGEWFEANV